MESKFREQFEKDIGNISNQAVLDDISRVFLHLPIVK